MFGRAILFIAVPWLVWRLIRSRKFKSLLSELPGPKPASRIAGGLFLHVLLPVASAATSTCLTALLGNIPDLFGPYGIDWQHDMVKKYGRVFKLYGLFGVRVSSPPGRILTSAVFQRVRLYITDPRAMQHILIKDQPLYQPTPIIIEWVIRPLGLHNILPGYTGGRKFSLEIIW